MWVILLTVTGAVLGVFILLTGVGRWAIARVETAGAAPVAPSSETSFADTRSGRVHCTVRGEGRVILLLHGSGRSIADWQEGIIDRLARRHRVVALDYYGCGFSDRQRHFTYGYDLWVQQAVDLLDALGVDRVTVVGHSVGGALACMMAARHPDRIDRVVTIGTGLAIEPAQFLAALPGIGELAMARAAVYGPTFSSRHRARATAAYKISGTRRALLMYIRRQMTLDGLRLLRGVFEDVKSPILHLSGSEDRNIAPAAARRLAARTKGRLVMIDGATHYAHIDAPDRVAAAIEEFMGD